MARDGFEKWKGPVPRRILGHVSSLGHNWNSKEGRSKPISEMILFTVYTCQYDNCSHVMGK